MVALRPYIANETQVCCVEVSLSNRDVEQCGQMFDLKLPEWRNSSVREQRSRKVVHNAQVHTKLLAYVLA